MRAIVTGSAGFIGGHVARHLLEHGWEVTGFDSRRANQAVHRQIEGDLRDPDAVEQAVAGHDVVFHIGGIGDVYAAAENPALAAAVNVVGSVHVENAAIAAGARVVYASTWEVYGAPNYEPVDEKHPCAPDHPYSITKLAGEQVMLASYRLGGAPVLALRLGTAYGPGLRPNSVFRIFIDRARRGQPIVVHGDGSQTRQFTHVSDIARAFDLAARASISGTAFNTVARESVSIKNLVEAVVSRYPTDVEFGDARPGDVPPARVSSDLIANELGWRAETSFEQGLDDLMDELEMGG